MKITTKLVVLATLVAGLVLAVIALQYHRTSALLAKQLWLGSVQSRWLIHNREILVGLAELDTAAPRGHGPAGHAAAFFHSYQVAAGAAALNRINRTLDEVALLARDTLRNARTEEDPAEHLLSQDLLAAQTALRTSAQELAGQWSELETIESTTPELAADFSLRRLLPVLQDKVQPAALALQLVAEKLIRHETAETEQEAAAVRSQALLMTLGIVGLLALMVYVLYRDVARPLRRMAELAHAIKPGVPHPPFHQDRRDELGVVALAFDEVLATLEARTTELSRLSLVADHTTNIVVITDAQGRIETVNAGFERVTGYTLAEVRGRKPGTFLQGPATDPRATTLIREKLGAGLPVTTELLNYAKDGHTYWLEINIQPLRDGAGRLTRFIAIESEITPRKLAEFATRRQAGFLSAINQTTLELLERRHLPELLQALIERTASLLDADRGELMLKDQAGLIVRAQTVNQAHLAGVRRLREEAPLAWQAHDTRQPVLALQRTPLHGLVPSAAIPILLEGECIGVIALHRDATGRPFGDDELPPAQLLARIAALTVNNASIYDDALRRAESHTAALRESEEHFRAVFDRSPVSIALVQFPEGRVTAFNAAAKAAFGLEDVEVIGRTTGELQLWADPAERDQYLRLLQTQGKITGFEAHMRRRNGEVFPVLYNASLIRIAGRAYSLNSMQDVTEWRRAEARFRDLFAFSPDAILIGTQDGIIVDANQRAEELFECTKADLVGRHPASLLPEEYRAPLAERLAHYLRSPVPHPMGGSGGALYARSLKGRVFPIDISLGPIRTDQGLLVVAALRDTTREQEAAAQLRRAQKMESLGTLAGGIAHDFNNILTGIFGFVQLARLDLPDAHPASRWLDQLSSTGNRAKELVQQILTFSRKKEGLSGPVRLQAVLTEALGLLRSTLPAMIDLQQTIDPDCPPVMADGTQIHQIVMNLCTNALHALPERHGLIAVSLGVRDLSADEVARPRGLRAGPHAVLTVRDNGHGMSPAVLEHIFEPFFTTKEAGKGSGLGLAVVHGIVESHSGAITVQSSPGQGTTFEIFFPVISGPVPAPGQLAADTRLPHGRGQRVLFVDDENAAGAALSQLIQSLGYQVSTFTDPHHALARFLSGPMEYDLVVTDLAMPSLPGNLLAAQLIKVRPDLPVIMITGYLDPEREPQIRASGVRAILHKPPAMAELAATLARCLPA